MKRDMDTVREILLKISDAPGKPDQGILVKGKSSEEEKAIIDHVGLLNDAGFITGEALCELQWVLSELTPLKRKMPLKIASKDVCTRDEPMVITIV